MTINRPRRLVLLPLSLAFVLLLAACGGEPEPTPTPTRPVLPTFTPTAVAQLPAATATSVPATSAPATPTADAPAATDTLAPAPAAQPQLTVDGDAVNIRSGPDTAYPVIATADQGEIFPITGRTALQDWWQICCFDDQPGWIFAALTTSQDVQGVEVAAQIPALPPTATPAPVVVVPTATPAPAAPAQPPDPAASSAGFFDPNAAYQITNFRVLGLGENNGGIRSSSSLHYILVTVLDAGGNPINGVTVRNLVGEKGDYITGSKGPGSAEITMFWEPFKLTVVGDTSQVSNQMGLAFPHLPDIVGKLGDVNYEYAVCPTIDIKCDWPIQAVHFSYEITFQKVK